MEPIAYEEFSRWVRDALNHLYDSPYLLKHPLATYLLDSDTRRSAEASQALRRVILEAIQSLRPGPGVPALSPDWRIYRILELRYLEGFSPQETMQELAIGRSQFFRDQSRVLDLLTKSLRERALAIQRDTGVEPMTSRDQLLQDETERLASSAHWECLDLSDVVATLRPLLDGLMRAYRATLRVRILGTKPVVRADRVMVRQVLLNLVPSLLGVSDDRTLELAVVRDEHQVQMTLRTRGRPLSEGERLKGARLSAKLMAAMEGAMTAQYEAGRWQITLSWPRPQTRTLLVIDDNESLIDLFRRYVAHRDWQVVGVRDRHQALEALREWRPDAILLDIMMPQEDGWDILTSLKRLPQTREVPIVICSVVNQPELPLSLGATAYLVKPVTQQALVDLLDRLPSLASAKPR